MEKELELSVEFYEGYAAGLRDLTNWLEHAASGLRMSKNSSLRSVVRICTCIAMHPDALMRNGVGLEVYHHDVGKVRQYYLNN